MTILVKSRWFTWESLERSIATFPYHGKDANSKPALMKSKKMQLKNSRNIVGTFRSDFSINLVTDSPGSDVDCQAEIIINIVFSFCTFRVR